MRLDSYDHEILAVLEKEGRISNRSLARRLGISESACRERVKCLEKRGAILGYRAVLSRSAVRERIGIWANISLADTPMSVLAALDEVLRRSPGVVTRYMLTGAYDHIVHFEGRSRTCWESLCSDLEAIGVGRDRIKFGIIMQEDNKISVAGEEGVQAQKLISR